jgi:hypothetical protein
MTSRKLNRLATQVAKLTSPLPAAYKPWGYTLAFDMMVQLPPLGWTLRCLPCFFPSSGHEHAIHDDISPMIESTLILGKVGWYGATLG